MNQPTPAIVAQAAVRRLPRWALWLFCTAYVLPGFVGRAPWRSADLSSYGVMHELAFGNSDWWAPTLGGLQPAVDALLPYWLGAWALQLLPFGLTAELAARLPSLALLALTLAGTWYASYHLARQPQAQPVAFAFGGEARPTDYARAIADGALLALMACLGLAQLGHEATPALAQLCSATWLLYALAAAPHRPIAASLAGAAGLLGLTLSGAPALAVLLGSGSALVYLLARPDPQTAAGKPIAIGLLLLSLLGAALATYLGLWHWQIQLHRTTEDHWLSLARLLLWFTWPSGPLALWTLWRWRRQWLQARLGGLHVLLPLWFALTTIATTLLTPAADRAVLVALPALAALAAFALPTLRRSLAAFIDWFTLIFFSGCAVVIWVVWLSMQTGIPAQPARNVARLAPGFAHEFSWGLFLLALLASLLWIYLVQWRVGRHRAALWKSAVLPAGGAILCWVLLMTLWLPLLDYARSYTPMVSQAQAIMGPSQACVGMQGLRHSQIAALQVHGSYRLQTLERAGACDWLIVAAPGLSTPLNKRQTSDWDLRARIGHPASRDEQLFVYQRQAAGSAGLTR